MEIFGGLGRYWRICAELSRRLVQCVLSCGRDLCPANRPATLVVPTRRPSLSVHRDVCAQPCVVHVSRGA
jgi:hypothetical protein